MSHPLASPMLGPILVTACQVFLNRERNERLKAFASIVLAEVFAVRDLKVIHGNEGLFVAMPSRRGRDGMFHDIAHPIVRDLREHIESVVLSEYEKIKATNPEGQSEEIEDAS